MVQEINNSILQQSAQFLNVGVQVFFIISAFLYGKKRINNVRVWLLRRGLRILIPFYLFMLILFVYKSEFLSLDVGYVKPLIYMLNLQGFLHNYTTGAAHLWFVSVIMVCYFITPLLTQLQFFLNKAISSHLLYSIIICAITIQIIAAFYLPNNIYSFGPMYLVYIYLYIFVYCFVRSNIIIERKHYIIFTLFTIIAVSIRLITKYITGSYITNFRTTLYEHVVVSYSHALLGLWIFITLFLFIRHFNQYFQIIKKPIMHCDKYSYEIYITHYMYIAGPIKLMHLTNNLLINIVGVLVCTYMSAILLHYLSNIVTNRLKLMGCNNVTQNYNLS